MAIQTASITDTMTGTASLTGSKNTSATSSNTMAATDAHTAGMEFYVSWSDHLAGSTASSGARLLDATQSELLTASESVSVKQVLLAAINDGIRMQVLLTFSGLQYDGWVVNLNNYAASRYSGFNFNSFCQYQGMYYGCSATGIHSLEAADDDGTPIEAFLSTGYIKPFSNSMARVPDAFLLVKNDGAMKVRVVVDGQIWTYNLENQNDCHKHSRVKLGKGLKSVAWRFEVANDQGSDFDIESFKIYPIELSRHI